MVERSRIRLALNPMNAKHMAPATHARTQSTTAITPNEIAPNEIVDSVVEEAGCKEGTSVGARVRSTTVGALTPRKVPPIDDESALEKEGELSPESTEAVKSVGEASPVAAKETTISKETDQL